jgi:membrane protease YdiL (CAAX protease family)
MNQGEWLGLVLRAGTYGLFAILGMALFPILLVTTAGHFAGAALTVLAAGLTANFICLRIWDRRGLPFIGLPWTTPSARNFGWGALGGSAAATLVLLTSWITGAAHWQPAPAEFDWPSIAFVSVSLLAGALGEELLFRGYGFQLLAGRIGVWATILPMGVLFGLAHSANANASRLGVLNTVAWGILFGYAFLRSRDLWLAFGLHFGWNLLQFLGGANVSGFEMHVTGWRMVPHPASPYSGGEYGPEGSILTTAVIAAVVYFLRVAPVRQQSTPLVPDDDWTAAEEN